jgi:hypothetical protein
MRYKALLEFAEGRQGWVTFETNIPASNLTPENYTTHALLQNFYPSLHFSKILAVAAGSPELTAYEHLCKASLCLEQDVRAVPDVRYRDLLVFTKMSIDEVIKAFTAD